MVGGIIRGMIDILFVCRLSVLIDQPLIFFSARKFSVDGRATSLVGFRVTEWWMDV
jgi:hypothetical protein